jgi:hypothetical protein
MTDRSERREEIKLLLEYVKVAISLAAIGSVIFAGLQWRIANENAKNANQVALVALYKQIIDDWTEELDAMVEHPELRPYFEDGKALSDSDENHSMILALADRRLNTMDAILTYIQMKGVGGDTTAWRNTFANAFGSSPVLCSRLGEDQTSYEGARIIPIWEASCPSR